MPSARTVGPCSAQTFFTTFFVTRHNSRPESIKMRNYGQPSAGQTRVSPIVLRKGAIASLWTMMTGLRELTAARA
jgi:hypothetical protein